MTSGNIATTYTLVVRTHARPEEKLQTAQHGTARRFRPNMLGGHLMVERKHHSAVPLAGVGGGKRLTADVEQPHAPLLAKLQEAHSNCPAKL